MDKAEVRKQIRRARSSCSESFDWRGVENMEEFKLAGTVMLYWSLPDEVDTHSFVERWWHKKRIVLPVVVGDEMILREYSPEVMVGGYRGILEPSGSAPEVLPDKVDFAVVPGVAFDAGCRRLGRGKGFYDRFLPKLRPECKKVGVAFDFQIVSEVPVDPWDVPLSAVVTPSAVYVSLPCQCSCSEDRCV